MKPFLLALVIPFAGWADLAHEATIRRDTFGVPHILAESEEAAAFAMGFAQAEDHCVDIARRFVAARGEEAKFFGTNAENDFKIKRYENHEVAERGFRELTPLFQRILDAYAAGFNRYVEKNRKELPDWIPRFSGIDVLAQGRAEILRFAFKDAPIKAVETKYPGTAATPAPASPDGGEGSNMWAISGSRTTSGHAILLGNPHQAWSALYWEAHVTVPGKINFYGATFAGRPVLTSGFNEYLGWTHTVNYPDLDDILTLSADPEQPDHYVFEGKSMPLTRRAITVEVKGAPAETRVYWNSHLGPIVHRSGNKLFALKSAYLNEFRYLEEWYMLNKAKSLEQFMTTLQMNTLPMFNIAYADAAGNILYLWNGTVPKRLDDGMDYSAEVPGDTAKYVWTSLHSTAELPQLLNPSGGYLQNCNDAPWYTSLRNRLDPAKYPSYFEPGRKLGLRTQMSLSMLEGQEKFSLEDVKRLKFNNRMLLADRVKPALIAALKSSASPEVRSGVKVFEAWDNQVSANSRGAVLFQRFWEIYTCSEGRGRFVPWDQKYYAQPWDPKNPAATPNGISDPPAAEHALEQAVRSTRKMYGSEAVAWGDVHRIRFGNLDFPGDGAGGEWGLFHVLYYDADGSGKEVAGNLGGGQALAGYGDGFIMAVEFSKPVQGYSLLAYGETANPASKHSSDQARLFANHEFKKIWFSEPEIKAHLERAYHPGE